jgi:hypothetical protein
MASLMPGEWANIPGGPNTPMGGGMLGGGMQGLLGGNNPLFNIGLGILANNYGNYGAFGPAVGRGVQQGIQQTQQATQFEQQRKQEEAMQEYRRKQQEMQAEQFDWQRQERAAETLQRQKQAELMGRLPQQLGVDPDILQAYPQVGQKLIEQRFMPKTPKIGFTPSGVAYDENDPSSLQLGQAYGKNELPSGVQEYEYAKAQGYQGSLRDWTTEKARAGAANTTVTYGAPVSGIDAAGNPVFFQPDKGGGAPAIVPGVRPKPEQPKAPTELQSKAGTFHSQMVSASNELGSLSREGFDPTSVASQVSTSLAGGITNPLAGPKAQQARQAQEQWSESFLRVKTGAAATQDEVNRNIRTFFPQVGDSPAVIAQKARARVQAEQDVASMAGPSRQAQPSEAKKRSRDDILKQYGVR